MLFKSLFSPIKEVTSVILTPVTATVNLLSPVVTAITSPIKEVTHVVTNILPDPSKEDNVAYNTFENIFDNVGQTLITIPQAITSNIPGVSIVGDIASSAISAVVKDVGIVADHGLMMVGQAADAIDTTVTGTVNIINKVVTDPTNIGAILADNDASGEIDTFQEIASRLVSYGLNNLEGHIAHDLDLLASPVDLVVDVLRDIENGTGTTIPGADFIDNLIDSIVVAGRDDISGNIFDYLRDLSKQFGLDISNAGTMPHKDHVNEGNIRGEGNEHNHGGSTGGNTGGSTGGEHNHGGSTGGNTGGSTGGEHNHGGSTGGNTGGSTDGEHNHGGCECNEGNNGGTTPSFNLGTIFSYITTPIKGLTHGFANVLPDPSKPDNITYNTFENIFDNVGQALIQLPKDLTSNIPGISILGDITSSVISGVVKDVGIVADHGLMMVGQAADAIDTTVTGTFNILNKILTNPTDIGSIICDNDNTGEIDSLQEILSRITSYGLNNLEGHIAHDLDLLASPVDLVVDILRDIENGAGIKIPGSDFIDNLIDGIVVTGRDDISGNIFDYLRDLSGNLGLDITNVGTMPHKDHVNEGNIRGEGNEHNHGGSTDGNTGGEHNHGGATDGEHNHGSSSTCCTPDYTVCTPSNSLFDTLNSTLNYI